MSDKDKMAKYRTEIQQVRSLVVTRFHRCSLSEPCPDGWHHH